MPLGRTTMGAFIKSGRIGEMAKLLGGIVAMSARTYRSVGWGWEEMEGLIRGHSWYSYAKLKRYDIRYD